MSTMSAWKRDIDPASKTEEIFFDNGDTLPALFNVDSRDIKEGKKIGEGIWTVHEAEWLGRKVAVKKFVAESTFGNVSLTAREVNRMLSLRHPNVLKLFGFYLTTQKDLVLDCTMIMELMDCDLEDYIGRGPLSDDEVVYLFAEVARGMNHIHKMGCFHRDLKPKNVLLGKSFVTGFNVDVKIADFGSSELMVGGDMNRTVGTIGYKAPEQFDSESNFFPDKADVFGFGALCFKILTGKEPYESRKNVREVIKQIDSVAISQRNLPEDVVEMIWRCLDVRAESRPDFEQISGILDGALSAIREKMPRPLPLSTRASLHLKECMSKGVQGHYYLESFVLHNMGLSKKHAIHFIPFEELLVFDLIGAGGTSSIYKVEWKGIPYALKKFRKVLGSLVDILGENYFQTFPKLLHKNILTFIGYAITLDEEICMIMELQELDLLTALHSDEFGGREPSLDIQKRWRIVREIAEGMKYLHDQGVGHGDLKPHNVMVSALNTDQMTVKLIDFANDIKNFTTLYGAPERLRSRVLLKSTEYIDVKKGDVYSFGILCHEILGGVPSWAQFYRMSPSNFKRAVSRGERPTIPIGTSPEMVSLIKSCWNGDPQERPDFTEVCKRLSGTLHYQSDCQGQSTLQHFAQRCCIL